MRITVRVTPNARTARVAKTANDSFAISVTASAERGKATDAARRALAACLGVAPSRLSLLMGSASRTKVFQLR